MWGFYHADNLTASKEEVWPEPLPISAIKPNLKPVLPMTPDMLPEAYRAWLVDIAERMQCPLDYVAVASLIVTASVIGAGCKIFPKAQDTWCVVPNLWGGIVGAPGTLKSPALKEVIHPLEELATAAHKVYAKKRESFLLEADVYQATKDAMKKNLMKAAFKADASTLIKLKQQIEALPKPKDPLCRRYLTNDATVEKLHVLLSENPRGLLLFRDELMGLLETWEKDRHQDDRSFYLEAWNGYGAKTTDRISRGTIHADNICLSILGGTQPQKLIHYFRHILNGAQNDGLLQRFQVLVYPDEPQSWTLVDRAPNAAARMQALEVIQRLPSLNFCNYGAVPDDKGSPCFRFEESAQEIFYDWLKELETKVRCPDADPLLIEYRAKQRKLVPSLALILHVINIASGSSKGAITAACLKKAIKWCDYLETHAQRIYALSLSFAYQGARHLAKKIQEGVLKGPFTQRDIYRKAWSHLKTKDHVFAALDVLIESGWIKEMRDISHGKTVCTYIINQHVQAKRFVS